MVSSRFIGSLSTQLTFVFDLPPVTGSNAGAKLPAAYFHVNGYARIKTGIAEV
jgi:hypothetical protein